MPTDHEIASTCPECGAKLNLIDYQEMFKARNEYWRRAETSERRYALLEAATKALMHNVSTPGCSFAEDLNVLDNLLNKESND